MNEYTKKYVMLLIISMLVLILEAFVFRFSGAFGLLLCLISIYLIIGSIIKLLKAAEITKSDFFDKIDILFFMK